MLSSLASVLLFSSPLLSFASSHLLQRLTFCRLLDGVCRAPSGIPVFIVNVLLDPRDLSCLTHLLRSKPPNFPHLCVLLSRQTQYSLSWSHSIRLPGSLLHSSLWLTGRLPWQQGAWECVSKAFNHTHKLDFVSFFLPIDATSATTSSNPHLLVWEHL